MTLTDLTRIILECDNYDEARKALRKLAKEEEAERIRLHQQRAGTATNGFTGR